MNLIKFYFTNYVEEIEINNITFVSPYKDVMDGTYDNGSFEFYCSLEELNSYKANVFLKEYEFIRRKIYVDDVLKDDKLFLINEFAHTKDSVYDDNTFKVTISYVESTKLLETYLMPNHTYSVKTIEGSDNTLYDEYYTKYFSKSHYGYNGMIYERNYQNFTSSNAYRRFVLDTELVNILKNFPNKNCTYVDYNFMDITRDKFASLSAVPYLDALNQKLTYISSFGKEKNLVLDGNNDKIVISSNYNRSTSNNADVIENKAENIVCDYESVWYPLNIEVEGVEPGDITRRVTPLMMVRPRGLNEGLEQYSEWSNWYLELPTNIDVVERAYGVVYDMGSPIENTYIDGSNYVVEDSIYSKMTITEQKYYAHYKRGDNKIYNIVQIMLSYENDIWPWDKLSDNEVAMNSSFAIKYKPMINTDITVVDKDINSVNKKNIVIDNKNISDTDLMAQTNYELDKNKYGEYVIEIAGEYQNIEAGDLIDFKNLEEYGIKDNKYLIYRVETEFDKEGSHQIIYFNEMVAKNNVLMNVDNLVRITQNLSTNQFVDRILKFTDAIGINADKVSSKEKKDNKYNTYCAGVQLYPGSLSRIFGVDNYKRTGYTTSIEDLFVYYRYTNISSFNFMTWFDTYKNTNEKDNFQINYISKECVHLNSGTVSQAICPMLDNVTADFKGEVINSITSTSKTLTRSSPVLYSDIYGLFYIMDIGFGPVQSNELIYNINSSTKNTIYYGSNYPDFSVQSESGIIGTTILNFINLPKYIKDTRDVMKFVYEQTYYSNDENKIKLSNYFTSTTSAFEKLPRFANADETPLYLTKRNLKDILIFEGKIYNINVIDESKAYMKIENANDYITYENDNIFVDISTFNLVGEYTVVVRGVINGNQITYINAVTNKITPKMVPQISYYDNFTSEDKYIRFSVIVDRLC